MNVECEKHGCGSFALECRACTDEQIDALQAENERLRTVLGWLRIDARKGTYRRLHPGGQQTGPSAWDGASMYVCLSVIRTVDEAIGPESPPEPSQPFKVAP